jgi:MFS family permease
MRAHTRGAPRSLWRNRNFMLLWTGQGLSALGTSVTELALPLLVLAITDSPAQAGFIAAVGTAPNLIFSLLAGALVDRWNRKLVMIVCDLARFVALGSVPLAYVLGYLSLGQLYLVAAVQGTCMVFFGLAEFASLPNVVPPRQITRASSLSEAAESGALLVGPGLAGTIVSLAQTARAGAALALVIDSFSYLASVISLLFMRIPFATERDEEPEAPLLTQIGDGLRFLWVRPGLRVMLLTTLSVVLFTSPLYVGVITLAETMGADAFAIGLIFSAASVGGIGGAILAPWLQERIGLGKMIISAALIPALLLPVIALATTPWVIMVAWAVIDITVPVFNVAQVAYRFSVVPDVVQGRVSSVFRMVGFGGIIVGTASGGVLIDQLGPRPVFWLMAGGLGLTAIVVSLTEIRRAASPASTVLRGSLRAVPPHAVLRVLAELRQTGLLLIRRRRLSGEVHFQHGRIAAAVLGEEDGIAALEGIALVLADGDFRFQEHAEPEWEGGEIELDDVSTHLAALGQERAYLARIIPSLRSIPRLVADTSDVDESAPLLVHRKTLRVLSAIDGESSVEAIAGQLGLVDTMRALAHLVECDVAVFEPHTPVAPPLPAPIVELRAIVTAEAERSPEHTRAAETVTSY